MPDFEARDFDTVLLVADIAEFREIRHKLPQLLLLALGWHSRECGLLAILACGAEGYADAGSDVISLQQWVASARMHGDAEPAAQQAAIPQVPPQPHLTPRERTVLALLVQGHSNKHIAKMLNISPGTAKNYVSRLLSEFGAATRAHLIASLSGFSQADCL